MWSQLIVLNWAKLTNIVNSVYTFPVVCTPLYNYMAPAWLNRGFINHGPCRKVSTRSCPITVLLTKYTKLTNHCNKVSKCNHS